MNRKAIPTLLVCVFAASAAFAQSPQANANAEQNQRKQINQVPDLGTNDPTPSPVFERAVDSVPVTVRADGTMVAQLDDTFMEAVTVSVGANGTLQYQHFTGLETASRAVRILPSRPLPPFFPILEERE
jgi:hypothetical protein